MKKYREYKKGQLVRVDIPKNHRINGEFYGDHYAIIIGSDSIVSSTVNVVYLTSKVGKYRVKLNRTIYEYILLNNHQNNNLLKFGKSIMNTSYVRIKEINNISKLRIKNKYNVILLNTKISNKEYTKITKLLIKNILK